VGDKGEQRGKGETVGEGDCSQEKERGRTGKTEKKTRHRGTQTTESTKTDSRTVNRQQETPYGRVILEGPLRPGMKRRKKGRRRDAEGGEGVLNSRKGSSESLERVSGPVKFGSLWRVMGKFQNRARLGNLKGFKSTEANDGQ